MNRRKVFARLRRVSLDSDDITSGLEFEADLGKLSRHQR